MENTSHLKTENLVIDPKHIGIIIGKGGNTINQIRKDTSQSVCLPVCLSVQSVQSNHFYSCALCAHFTAKYAETYFTLIYVQKMYKLPC